jgi:DNA primase
LFVEKNNSQNSSLVKNYYDRFRARIMFPIYNNSNEPIAFTGRIFQGKNELKTVKNIDETGKYC